jgi:transcription antitermination factor NusG
MTQAVSGELHNSLPWFIAKVWGGRERVVVENCKKLRVEAYSPIDLTSCRGPYETIRAVKRALFPGYVLMRYRNFDEDKQNVERIPFFSGLLSTGKNYAVVHDIFVECIRYGEALRAFPAMRFQVSDRVRVGRNAFANLYGTILDIPSRERITYLLQLNVFGRLIEMEFKPNEIEPA